MTQSRETLDAQMVVWIVFLLVVLFIIPAVYVAKAGVINGALLSFAKIQLQPFALFSEEAQNALERIASVDPANLTWEQMKGILRYVGTWLRWPCVFFLILLGSMSFLIGRTNRLIRRLNMYTLLVHNAESFACLRPIVGRGKYLLSSKSYDKGLWRIARSPVQFAWEHGLLLNTEGKPFEEKDVLRGGLAYADVSAYGKARFNEKNSTKIFEDQLGTPFRGYKDLLPWRKALACAFIAYATGDKSTCINILDKLSLSYVEIEGVPTCPIIKQENFQNIIFAVWEKHKDLLNDKLMQRHTSFELPWFMALLTLARKKGVLASSQFLWLRPLDRPLWYALNQCGGRTAWVEGVAAWSHYAAEEKAGKALSKPQIRQAVLCLKEALAKQGWFLEKEQKLVSSGAEIKNDMVFFPAESDPTYDANTDKTLHAEKY